jgi:hypothetical protein
MTGWLTLLLLSQAAPAVPPSDTINVIGRKPEEMREEAKAFLAITGVAERPVARWIDPICPAALDVREDAARRVVERIRAVASAAGARVAQGKCTPNLKIVFSSDAQTLIRQVSARTGGFSDLPAKNRALLQADFPPVRWWHTVQERTKDGLRPMYTDTPPAAGMDTGSGQVTLGGLVHQQYRSSFLSSQMVRGIIAAKVVIDVKLAEGIPLDSVADYAALVGLAEIRLAEQAPPNSILSLFTNGGPRELTATDQTFLRTLYKLPLDRTAIAHRGLLIRGLVGGEEASKADR